MQQTLLALVALLMATTYSLGVARNELHLQQAAIHREVEEMATFAVLEVMEIARERPFDQAVVDSTTDGTTADLGRFSFNNTTDHFTVNDDCSIWKAGAPVCDDLDDFHGITTRRPFPLGADTVLFDVHVRVEYVDENLQRASERTFRKRVVVETQDVWPGSEREPFLAAPVELTRVFAYTFQ